MNDVPFEILDRIIGELDDASLLKASETCHRLQRAVSGEHHWRQRCGDSASSSSSSGQFISWKREYKFRRAAPKVDFLDIHAFCLHAERLYAIEDSGLSVRPTSFPQNVLHVMERTPGSLVDANDQRIVVAGRGLVSFNHHLQRESAFELTDTTSIKGDFCSTLGAVYSLDWRSHEVIRYPDPPGVPLTLLPSPKDTLYVGGRFGTVLAYDSRMRRIREAIHSAPVIASLAHFGAGIVAGGMYKGRGSLEVFTHGERVYCNRSTVSTAAVLAVDARPTRVAVGGGQGAVRCFDAGLRRVVKEIRLDDCITSMQSTADGLAMYIGLPSRLAHVAVS